MIAEAELRRMSQAERRELARILAEIDNAPPAGTPPDPSGPVDPYQRDPGLSRQRRLALGVLTGCCVILAGWTVLLAATLPHHFNAQHWRALWVNFDVLLLAAFAATAWATWRKRQILILLLTITGTMLCCDAWFDVGTSLATSTMWVSIADAVFAELPLAFLAFAGARRLLRATVEAAMPAPAASPSLRRTRLSGAGLEGAFPGGHHPAASRACPLAPTEYARQTLAGAGAE